MKCDICTFDDNDPPLYGEILSSNGINVHYLCLLSSIIPQRCALNSGIKGFAFKDIKSYLPIIKNYSCYICKENSAAVTCALPNCNRRWHYKCGRKESCITQFIGIFNSYCDKHIPDSNLHKHKHPVYCPVCFETIQQYNPAHSIISKCCLEAHKYVDSPHVALEVVKKCGFVHSECIQRYVYNAGYFSKCVICCMKGMTINDYQNDMRLKGIFIPMKDAEWEKDEYFLNMTKNKCEDKNCPNPSISRNVWTCIVCGCYPRHLSCANVDNVEDYYCMLCIDQSFTQRVPFTSRYKKQF
ncbi:hypothetical protein PVAND_007022 [Polypedilum vanderplanki]|uniref:PHD-type domain-containing protein n=1 Tax=Polypedilum vanderplanki TaxID=319348 RepID=A0A9J6C5F0_POLVA|nr:hypothetical protein PVAND_007022 [Polypedilum vanderplanki]